MTGMRLLCPMNLVMHGAHKDRKQLSPDFQLIIYVFNRPKRSEERRVGKEC